MDNDQRDRRDWPDPDRTDDGPGDGRSDPGEDPRPAEPLEPARATDDTAAPVEPSRAPEEPSVPPDWSAREQSPSAAEIESWPSQDAGTPPASPYEPEPGTAWPTEPPAAGSGSAESWPTSPPERGAEPVSEPAWDATAAEPPPAEPPAAEPPPSEIEAYPADSTGMGGAAPIAAGTAGTAAHAVPEAEASTGESTQCPRCGTENRPGLAFCRNCGQRLVAAGVATTVERPGAPEGTMACPRCGTHNRAGVAFCQNCGANLRGTAPGYVPPAVPEEGDAVTVETERRGAVLGPVVLLVGLVGLITAYMLPFLYGTGSLFERAWGADGYGAAFWSGYPDVGANVADQAYFGLTGPVPLFALLLGILAIAGFMRARPGALQTVGLAISLLWSVGIIVLFAVVELAANWDGDMVGLLRVLTPAGIIFFLSALIVLIGTLTRFGRS